MLNRLQRQIEQRYDLTPQHRVSEFVVSDPLLVAHLGADPDQSSEQLLLRQDGEDLEMSLYLDADLIGGDGPLDLHQVGAIIEGVSHFTYVTYCARHDRSTTELELELQGEIDKFFGLAEHLSSPLAGGKVDLGELHVKLFENISWRVNISDRARERYETVNRLAAQLCQLWIKRYGDNIGHPALRTEARRFYRMGQQQKLRHAAGHWKTKRG